MSYNIGWDDILLGGRRCRRRCALLCKKNCSIHTTKSENLYVLKHFFFEGGMIFKYTRSLYCNKRIMPRGG